MSSIEERVKKIIVDNLGVDAKEVTPEASFVEDLGADSLDLTELIMAMEEEFNLEIGDEEALKLLKVEDAYKYIAEHSS
ncbi:MAG: acyl carrier protein [Deltaproteobacteria bacterium]|jgi:acyl carrier protein|nr:acyl carrier protein [Deltaproteobacteria bacterium]